MRTTRQLHSSWLLPTIAALSFFSMTALAASTTALPNLSSAEASESVAATATTSDATGKSTATADGSVTTGSGSSETNTAAATTTGLTLPTLSATGGSYTSVSVSVPPTANAPYMQVSDLPDGTVFIVVGAILGFFAMSILLWRGLIAWSLHRSVKRANMQQYMSMDAKANFRAPPAPFYKYSDRDSVISLSGLPGKGGKKGPRPQNTAPPAANASSLFFSPTAGAVGNNAGNRGSTYLPAGYYAAGAPAPGNGPYESNISMSTLEPRPQSQGGYDRVTPPIGQDYYDPNGASSSTLNLHEAPGNQRAPTVYLDDLFDGSNRPPASQHGNYRHSRQQF